MTASADSARPPAGSRSSVRRVTQQRLRILDAAEKCFIESGFHAASMAHIAATAGVSAGLIYRYFDSKSAIVRAIIERHLRSDGCRMIDELDSSSNFCDTILEVFERWRCGVDPKMNAALMLELTAESTRDPRLAKFIRNQDRAISKSLTQRVRRTARSNGANLTAVAAHGRAVILQCLVEGLASRSVRDPGLRGDILRPALEKVIAALMS